MAEDGGCIYYTRNIQNEVFEYSYKTLQKVVKHAASEGNKYLKIIHS